MPHGKRLEGVPLGSYTNENRRITFIVHEIFLKSGNNEAWEQCAQAMENRAGLT